MSKEIILPTVETLVADIDKRAERLNLSRSEILRRAGVSQPTFQNWKSGESSPTIETVEKIHEVLRDAEGA